METLISLLCGFLVACAVFMMLERNMVKFLFGLILLSNASNLIIFGSGRLTRGEAPFVPEGMKHAPPEVANALPQALMLTAIVISFGLLAFALILAYRFYEETGSVDMDEIGASANDEVVEPSSEIEHHG